MIDFPDRLSLAQTPTPIHPLDRFSALLNKELSERAVEKNSPRLWIKRDDLTGCAASGNKIRKLEFILAEAKQQGANVLITCGGVQSNHARATAILGAQLGFKVHLLLRGEPEELTHKGNHFLDVLAGAEISCYPSKVFVPNFDSLVSELKEHYIKLGLKPFFIPIGGSDATGTWGYIKASEEIKGQLDDLPLEPDHIVCACGSGGTLAGLTAGNAIYNLGENKPVKIWGVNVCDNAAYFEKKSRQDLRDWKNKFSDFSDVENLDVENLPIQVIDGYVGPGYSKAEKPVYDLIKQLARSEGIILDSTYTAKAFYGLVSEIKKGRFDGAENILFIHTGGLFGLMADPKIQA